MIRNPRHVIELLVQTKGLVFDGCLRRDNFRHHISQLEFVGQQLVNKYEIPLTYNVITKLIIIFLNTKIVPVNNDAKMR